MSDPLSLVPLAIAARGGRIDGVGVAQLVAAGVTMLQRSAPLVRALATGRSAILLPPSPPVLVALAASDGRGALVLDPDSPSALLQEQLLQGNAGAVFTTSSLADRVGAERVLVLLDDAPTRVVIMVRGVEVVIDVGSHFGLALEGEQDSPGRDEEFVVFYSSDGVRATAMSHRALLSAARGRPGTVTGDAAVPHTAMSPISTRAGLLALLAPLLAGESVQTSSTF